MFRRDLTILLAEDDDDIRLGLTQILCAQGYNVKAVNHGAALLDVISTLVLDDGEWLQPDVIVTDVRMPGLNGLNVLEGLRDLGWSKPIVVISAFSDSTMSRRVEALGRAVLIPKPFSPELLEQAIQKTLADS